ncbi:MAG: glycosyltransferase [Oculatellaceae cyanobacterium Prado106]|jgi:glycosyltransferase involved in cell wall biosynthesis|nr:glycosyltransferase [Oculatellaceae cyanobacterium Prado106]
MNSSITFSIVIPTYNRPQSLDRCLNALSQLAYERDRFEVIVVDDGSHTSLTPILDRWQPHLNLACIRQSNAGPAAARNRGALQAQGQYLAFTDDDCSPLPGWLTAFEQAFQAEDALLGGHTLNALPENLCSTASQLLIDYLYQYYNVEDNVGDTPENDDGHVTGNQTKVQQSQFFASNNFAMPTDYFHKVGGFDTSFPLAAGEDREFCDRWQQFGYGLQYVPSAQIAHAHSLKLSSFWRQHFNYGRGAFHFHQARALRQQSDIQVEPWKFYSNLLTYPMVKPTSHPTWKLFSLLFLSQVATVGGFFWERNHHKLWPVAR